MRFINNRSFDAVSLLLLSLGSFDRGFTDAALPSAPYEVETGLYLVISKPGRSCTHACSKVKLMCSVESLAAGKNYYTSDVFEKYVVAAGGVCENMSEDRIGTTSPAIDGRNYCFGRAKDSTNYNCDLSSGMEGPGRRFCACFPVGDSDVVPLPDPEPAVPEPEPTPKPTPEKTPEPTLEPTVEPTPKPTPEKPMPPPVPVPPPPPTPAQGPPPSTGGVPPGYELVWQDQFDGNDIDTNNWSRGLIYDQNPDQHVLWDPKLGGPHLLGKLYDGYILDKNTVVKNGAIHLHNDVEDPPIEGTWPTGTFEHSSGFANSLHKVYFNGSKRGKGNYLEIRAKFPSGNVGKAWSAVWLVPESESWPPEIDILEYFGIFFDSQWGVDQLQYRVRYGWYGNTTAAKKRIMDYTETYGTDYHIFGFHWTWQKMTWYIDNVEIGYLENGVDIVQWRWPDEDMAFVLQNGLMESVDVDDPAMSTDFPNTMSIDWMALYEKK